MSDEIMLPNYPREREINLGQIKDGVFARRERRQLKKQRKKEERQKEKRKQKTKKAITIVIVILLVALGIFGLVWFLATRPPLPESEIISQQGLHWHADLTIKILGQEQEIPGEIGIGAIHKPIHTHDPDGVIHLEFPGLVREKDIRLGKFFENWGKEFNQECIFAQCNGPEGEVKMFVQGEPNYEFENYIMQDNDKIEIIFE